MAVYHTINVIVVALYYSSWCMLFNHQILIYSTRYACMYRLMFFVTTLDVHKANMDGSGYEHIVSIEHNWVHGVAVNPSRQQVCWSLPGE